MDRRAISRLSTSIRSRASAWRGPETEQVARARGPEWAKRVPLSTWEGPVSAQAERGGRRAGSDSAVTPGAGGGGFGGQGTVDPLTRPRVVLSFPTDTTQMLLSGTLAGGRVLSGRAQVVDAPVGAGHGVMFAIRPFWRWQTQGTFMLGFNTIMNWNDLSAGRTAAPAATVRAAGSSNP